jgi:hypothetical protein
MTWVGWIRVLVSRRQLATMLYYLAVLLGLLVLYGRGDLPTSGFIYQAY